VADSGRVRVRVAAGIASAAAVEAVGKRETASLRLDRTGVSDPGYNNLLSGPWCLRFTCRLAMETRFPADRFILPAPAAGSARGLEAEA